MRRRRNLKMSMIKSTIRQSYQVRGSLLANRRRREAYVLPSTFLFIGFMPSSVGYGGTPGLFGGIGAGHARASGRWLPC